MSITTAKLSKDEIRAAALADLENFIRLVAPNRVLGLIHCDLIAWRNRADAKSHQMILLPRDHQKSAIFGGFLAAWEITRNPAIKILYVSSTSLLATKQLKFIKDILTSPIYRRYWPEMVNLEEAKREKWTETEIAVDHPLRKEDNVRDATVFAAGLTTNVVGLHCDLTIIDDAVVNDTAYTEEGRKRLETQFSLLASIEGALGRQVVVGTRYHPKDLYGVMMSIVVEQYDDNNEVCGHEPLYEVRQHEVEDRGDGTGEFLWPVQFNKKGQQFGFNASILARKKAQYIDQIQFRAQYYNDPNDPEGAGIKREEFQYYERSHLSRANGYWYYKGNRLNIFAAVDFAYTLSKAADFSSIVVVGVDSAQNFYVLDVDRFKGDVPSTYFKHILHLFQKWDFRKLVAEATAAQSVIVKDLKNTYVRQYGLALSIEELKPTRNDGSKKERILSTLQPRYSNKQMWHYMGGHCQTLEEELVLDNPPHDDVKDALSIAVNASIAPSYRKPAVAVTTQHFNRFGGI